MAWHYVAFPETGDLSDPEQAPSKRLLRFVEEGALLLPRPIEWSDETFPVHAAFNTPSDEATRQLRELAAEHGGRMHKGRPPSIRV